jgi:leader peptidase (prepilin peptidase)/N-methyltransferase
VTLETLLIIVGFVFGGVCGSFFNVVIYRLPKGESIVMPPSHCMKCGEPINWYDNIPLISYIVLGGRCRACKEPYSFRYFVVELLTAVLVALVVSKYVEVTTTQSVWKGVGLTLFHLFFVGGMIVSAFTDFDHHIIPNEVTYPGVPLGLLAASLFPEMMFPETTLFAASAHWKSLLYSFIASIGAGGFLFVIGEVVGRVIKKEALGMGDVKLLAVIGAFLGWKLALLTILFSSLVGLFGHVVLVVAKKSEWRAEIPFGVYIVPASLISYFWGHAIIGWYITTIIG